MQKKDLEYADIKNERIPVLLGFLLCRLNMELSVIVLVMPCAISINPCCLRI